MMIDKRLVNFVRENVDQFSAAPTKTTRHEEFTELVIGIGCDNVAHLTMTREALNVLLQGGEDDEH